MCIPGRVLTSIVPHYNPCIPALQMKNRKLKFGLSVSAVVALGVALPVVSCRSGEEGASRVLAAMGGGAGMQCAAAISANCQPAIHQSTPSILPPGVVCMPVAGGLASTIVRSVATNTFVASEENGLGWNACHSRYILSETHIADSLLLPPAAANPCSRLRTLS